MLAVRKKLFNVTKFFETIYVRVVLASALLMASHGIHAQSPEIKKVYHHITIEQPSHALGLLNELSSKEEKSTELQYHIGIGYLRLGKLDEAIKAFEEGIALKKKDGLNYAGKGHAMILQGKDKEAEVLLANALDLGRGKDAQVMTAVAAAYVSDSTNLEKAIDLLNKAKARETGNRQTYLLLGDAYLLLNKGGESVSNYEWAAKSDPSWALPHFKIAMVYNLAKNYDMVFQALDRAVALDNSFAPAYKKLGEMYYVRKEAGKAVDAYEKYLSITENPGDARYQYAFFLIMARQFDKANKIFEEVIHGDNVRPIALKYYAFSLLEQDTARTNAERARPLLEKYMIQMKPGEIQAADHAYYGKLLLKLNEDSLAHRSFAKSLALDSAQEDILTIYAKSLMKNKKFDEAADVYEQIVRLDETPTLQKLWYLGQAYYFDEQYVNADSTFEEILDKQSIDKLPYQVLLFSARSKANIDSTMSAGLAKPMYEAFLDRISKNISKFSREAIETYTYLGAYYVHKEENVAKAKTFYEKVLELDASNPTAKQFMKTLNEQPQKKTG